MSHKVGIGYDVHKLQKGRKLILGGVEIPYEKGLEGHSDADVLLHAVCDALLGAIGKGDIGEHFPDNEDKYKDISSLILLENIQKLVAGEGYVINNIDTMVLAEGPSIKRYKSKMRKNISKVLKIDAGAVNIKATTNEGLGFVGRREGMAAYAVASVEK